MPFCFFFRIYASIVSPSRSCSLSRASRSASSLYLASGFSASWSASDILSSCNSFCRSLTTHITFNKPRESKQIIHSGTLRNSLAKQVYAANKIFQQITCKLLITTFFSAACQQKCFLSVSCCCTNWIQGMPKLQLVVSHCLEWKIALRLTKQLSFSSTS